MKKALKGLLLVAGVLLQTAAAVLVPILYQTRFAKTEVETVSSPGGQYQLEIDEVGEPVWPFGPTRCRFVLREGRRSVTKYDFQIYNDGCRAQEENFAAVWTDDGVTILVTAEEQPDISYFLHFDGSAVTTAAP